MTSEEKSRDVKTYNGSCHCGDVRFEARVDLAAGFTKCNCSICRRLNYVGTRVMPADFTLLSAKENLSDYMFGSNSVHHYFCRRCGVPAFGHANIPQAGGEYYSVNAHCLEDLDLADIASAKVKYCDGANNNWWNDALPFP